MLPALTLIVGAAASGKSTFAERLVKHAGRPSVYIATAQTLDDEMRDKVRKHREQRGPGWRTVEEPLDVTSTLMGVKAGEVVLFDCATLWLTNHMLADHDLVAEEAHLLATLTTCAAPVVVVANEVGAGIVPENALARRFREAQGRFNQKIASASGLVVTTIAGLPLVLKGTLPDGFK